MTSANVNQSRPIRLALFLTALLVANSTMALEVLVHGGHGHHADMASMDMEMTHDGDMHGHSESSDDAANSEDCLCDDICCVGNTGFGISALDDTWPHGDDQQSVLDNLYKSISIELTPPPPNA